MRKLFGPLRTMQYCLLFVFSFLFIHPVFAQQKVKKVVLQAFWWDYWNANFPASWANYITEMAPRLKSMGIDAVWIPPSYKNGGVNSVGYSPFDHYDLGDKYQKPDDYWTTAGRATTTRVGTKDELLRMIAVLHANGIEVIQDIVLNHVDNAGSGTGNGGQDTETTYSMVTNSGYKNFRYVSYATPVTDESATDYWNRSGRWSKNYQNFHPHSNHNSVSDAMTEPYWGPDICYGADCVVGNSGPYFINSSCSVVGGYGVSSNVIGYNPAQTGNYMRNQSRDWIMWFKKQTGVDGFRWDAVKHFDVHTQQDLSHNLKYLLPDFAKGGDEMLNVGEYVGGKAELDRYTDHIFQANGGNNFSMGTFDFGLRAYDGDGAIKSMTDAGGFYDMWKLAGAQQNWRYTDQGGKRIHRTMPFVNNHDTYRPTLDANGNITGWNTGSELSPHIEPGNIRLPLAYAVIMSVDGNPQLFFEDLFNVYNTGKRFSHLPNSNVDLPVNNAINNIIWAHQVLGFKEGDFKVRSADASTFWPSGNSANDLLIVERSGKALIGMNDRGDASGWQQAWVDSDFPPGTVLKDYSGANGTATYTVPGDRRVLVNTPPVVPASNWYGYSIWAPVGFDGATYTPTRATQTTQEWEMANDLGDSHCESLGYGGALPANSTNQRVAGKIFAAAGNAITYKIFPEIDGVNITGMLSDLDGNIVATASGTATAGSPLTITYTPTSDKWIVVKVRHTNNIQAAQKVWCNVAYTAPQVVDTRAAANSSTLKVSIWTGNAGTTNVTDCRNWEEGKLPDSLTHVIIPAYSSVMPVINAPLACKNLVLENGTSLTVNNVLSVTGNITNNGAIINGTTKISMGGNVTQTITGVTSLPVIEINNVNGVTLNDNISINNDLQLTMGNLLINNNNIQLANTATITGGSSASYIQTGNNPSNGGVICTEVGSVEKLFPIGNTNYTPLKLVNTGTAMNFCVRNFEQVLMQGTFGSTRIGDEYINKTWVIDPATATGANVTAAFQWNNTNQLSGFSQMGAYVAKHKGDAAPEWTVVGTTLVNGTNPYTASITGITNFSKFAVLSEPGLLPVSWVSFTATPTNKGTQLKWQTGSEQNNKGFEILRSTNGRDYSMVHFEPASMSQHYNWLDVTNGDGKVFYKLKQIDNDGKYTYSNVVVVERANENKRKVIAYPNPFTNELKLISNIDINEPVTIHIYNAQGMAIVNYSGTFIQVSNSLTTWFKAQASGLYLLQLKTNSDNQTIKLLKK